MFGEEKRRIEAARNTELAPRTGKALLDGGGAAPDAPGKLLLIGRNQKEAQDLFLKIAQSIDQICPHERTLFPRHAITKTMFS